MRCSKEELKHRRPVWRALADLFVDNQLDESDYRFIARRIEESGYAEDEVLSILWNEVFPVVEYNIRLPAGEWNFFDEDWLEEQILGSGPKQTREEQSRIAEVIEEEWEKVLKFLPQDKKQSQTGPVNS